VVNREAARYDTQMLSEPIRELLERVDSAEQARDSTTAEQMMEGTTVFAKAASVYEKIRYLIDYREEHTIRRAALERILKRRVFIEGQAESGLVLLQELVDGKYIPKELATEEAARDIDGIIYKFLELRRLAGSGVGRRILSFAATEIDSRISPLDYAIDHATAEALYKTMHGHVSAYGYGQEEVNQQLYAAAWRSLLSADNERLAYALWLLYVPEWKDPNPDLSALAARLASVLAEIKNAVAHPLQWQIGPRIKNESIYFRIIREVLQVRRGTGERILQSPVELDNHTRDFLEKKYEKENERIQKSGIRAVLYLFFTKMVVALIAELPYELFVLGGVHVFPLTVNILFHPALLFALTRRVGALDEKNTAAIIEGLHAVLYEGKVRTVRIRSNYSNLSLAFGFAYLLLFFIVFGGVIGILQLLGFNPVSIVLFLFFLALVSYFAFRIRYQARRWKVIKSEGAISVVGNMLAVPIVRTGRYLSQTFSSINVFVLILDFIIETPFKRLLNFSNQFLLYLREKSDELR